MYKLNFDIQAFLANDWQQAPKVFKGAFPDFEDPIAADELAGLACEEEVSSRVVVTKGNDWEVISGPFEDYDRFGETHWQLLVQAVNHWYPDAQPLVEAFRFLPDWRFDDLMVSFATPQGGVGPHIDNYDVFIIQGEGQRRWTVGPKGNYKRRGGVTTSPLIEDFEPIIDVVLEKGDVLYIPPGFPHQGETLSLALSYSMGYRAPSQQELAGQIADQLMDEDKGHKRFIAVDGAASHGTVSLSEQQGIMQLIRDLCDDADNVVKVLGKLLSQNRFDLDVQEDESIDADALVEALDDGAVLMRIGGLKVLKMEGDSQARLFVAGESVLIEGASEEELIEVSNSVSVNAELALQPHWRGFFVQMLQKGYFYLGED
ncbi:cupin domain-containing protein [Shewanella litorisediminis]|uniref:Cupin domain-containing protein n=1 Tax=Shewanella litorisediminis TaxID=1173586 RepID=A0ABX7FZB2_9GAMM|nr:cupin domain-containing protein [Shewanella litorisediminis]MCL2918677.1 cupin domain-containing protein [Shewanella litorisediminis]QRH00348.1 cupin domain-containing protein [Shewanella litorisediminis]